MKLPTSNISHITDITSARIFFTEILIDKDSCLYLDNDLLISGDINKLTEQYTCNSELHMAEKGASIMKLPTKHQQILKEALLLFENSRTSYYNAGVIMFNLKLMRKNN